MACGYPERDCSGVSRLPTRRRSTKAVSYTHLFTVREKLSIAKLLLDELHVDRIEIASARVSEGEAESTRLSAACAR